MFHPYYESRSLGQVFYLKNLKELNRSDSLLLERELATAIDKMRERMHEERDTADSETLNKLSVKLNITEQFFNRLSEIRKNDLSKIDQYHLVFLRQRLANQLGPLVADKMMTESRQDAMRQIGKESNS